MKLFINALQFKKKKGKFQDKYFFPILIVKKWFSEAFSGILIPCKQKKDTDLVYITKNY